MDAPGLASVYLKENFTLPFGAFAGEVSKRLWPAIYIGSGKWDKSQVAVAFY